MKNNLTRLRSVEYWQARAEELEKLSNANMEVYNRRLMRMFDRSNDKIQKEIESWYGRFAINNEIDIVEAKKLLKLDELVEFKWTVSEYIAKAKENQLDGRYIKQLENASARVHINRLEALQLELRQEVEMLYKDYNETAETMLKETLGNDYFRLAFEIQRGIGMGFKLRGLDPRAIDIILNKPWTTDGIEFSQRIWTSRNQLVNELMEELLNVFSTGDDLKGSTNRIAKKFQTKKWQASRLMRTEHANISTESRRLSLKDFGCKEYQYLATLDNRTSEVCQGLDLKTFRLKDMQVGVNAPPMHPNCRSTTTPVVDRNFGTRAARSADGETVFVRANMTYDEWLEEIQGIVREDIG